MGYELHITRKNLWHDDEGPEITIEEWRSIVDSDPGLIPLPPNELNPLSAMFLGPPSGPGSGSAWYFNYGHGDIQVKKPIRDVLFKMLEVAEKLNARVMGDDEEIYEADGTTDTPSSQYSFEEDDE